MNKQLSDLKTYIEWFGPMHENCLGDDTCNCAGKEVNESVGEFFSKVQYTTIRDMLEIYLKPLGSVEIEKDMKRNRVERANSVITALYSVMNNLDIPESYQLLKVRIIDKK